MPAATPELRAAAAGFTMRRFETLSQLLSGEMLTACILIGEELMLFRGAMSCRGQLSLHASQLASDWRIELPASRI